MAVLAPLTPGDDVRAMMRNPIQIPSNAELRMAMIVVAMADMGGSRRESPPSRSVRRSARAASEEFSAVQSANIQGSLRLGPVSH